ncbi:ammonium permease MEP2 [Sugiyamaella lignohabitans]|uniref:Ammonium transporter n=1 Tax=Sugiyamaella lignohabitans TaxID=796027 RepID=A0A167FN08_9ASCO|nr:ammonium permease MEP2 [Sugiyamaella lignohabitans]ANB15496.1 ammonium permease MEP2 [Sugiyamaella lignohabitans]
MGDTGGDSLTTDVNKQYDLANMVWIMTAGALVWIMIPGVGLLYSGLSRKKHGLSLIWAGMMATALVSFQWFFWGYSLTFSHEANKFLGKLDNFAMMNVLAAPSVGSALIPDILYMFYQGMFAAITGMLMVGGAHERARLGPMMVFLFIWMTVVYCPIACWTWNPAGWIAVMGGLDFAGGGPVHMTSGAGALAYALICGKRNDPAATGIPVYKPHNIFYIVLGTIFLWFGWFGFNGGSSGNATIRGYYAAANTNLAASCGALAWMFLDYFRKGKKWSTVALCSGAIAGLVGITPAAGFVPIYFAVPTGILAAVGANLAGDLKHVLRIDDGLDIFALHGVGGFIGSICTGLFAADYVAALDGLTVISGGWINHHYKQLGFQLAGACATLGWSFVVSAIILFAMDKIPGLHLRMHAEDEATGTDLSQIGELAMWEEEDSVIPGVHANTLVNPTPEKHSRTNSQSDVTSPEAPVIEA